MTDWMDDAHCRTRPWHALDLDAQREVCDGCPVRTRCLEWGRETLGGLTQTVLRELAGDARPDLWGGRTFDEIIKDTARCAHDDCTRLPRKRGLCPTHYMQLYRRMEPCRFDGCGRNVVARGLCRTHYSQEREGKPLRPIQQPKLTAADVAMIRALSQLGHTHAGLARRYKIARKTVTEIVAGRVYKGIAPASLDEARRLLEETA